MSPLSRFAVLLAVGVAAAHEASAQVTIPIASITLAYPNIDPVELTLNGTARFDRPSPFVISGVAPAYDGTWFCLEPLQLMFYAGGSEPVGSNLVFGSTNPADFDLWGAPAPGLTAARIQNLADLFQAYAPTATTSLLAGALQLAVWEVANESTAFAFSLSGPGYLNVVPAGASPGSADMIALASVMLASLGDLGIKNTGDTGAVKFLIDGSYPRDPTTTLQVQDLVGFTPLLPVPEPSTYALGATLVLLVATVVRRARRSRSPDCTSV